MKVIVGLLPSEVVTILPLLPIAKKVLFPKAIVLRDTVVFEVSVMEFGLPYQFSPSVEYTIVLPDTDTNLLLPKATSVNPSGVPE